MTIDNDLVLARMPPAAEAIGRAAPDVTGISSWLNTMDGNPVSLPKLRGKVVLVDFWTYSCMNSRRAIAHVVDWYARYKNFGFEAVGIHSPEYAFEEVPENVGRAAAGLGGTYPIGLDNRMSTWTAYRNRWLPAQYLVDAYGILRHIKFGEGDYRASERLIRTLMVDAHPGETLPSTALTTDNTPPAGLTEETHLSVGKAIRYGGTGAYGEGDAAFDYPPVLAEDTFAYRGAWILDHQGVTAVGEASSIRINRYAHNVYIVAGGHGAITVMRGGVTTTVPVSGPPDLHQIAAGSAPGRGHIEVQLSAGIQAFSVAYG